METATPKQLDQERKWIEAAKKDPEAFEPIFQKYNSVIFNYILRRTCDVALAKDLTADTFLKALENLSRFHWRNVPFSAWLYRIATNEVKLHYRKNNRLSQLSDERISRLKSDKLADDYLIRAENAVQENRQFQRMHRALKTLNMKYQTVLTLRYFENLSIRDIARIMDLSENTIKTHIHRGIKHLKKAYEAAQ